MSGDPVQDFVQQLAVQVATGALTGVWAKLKEWVAHHRHPASRVVTQFERDPAAHIRDLVNVLRELQFDNDSQGRTILAEGLNQRTVSQTASGQSVIQVGGDVGTIHMAAPVSGSARERVGLDVWGAATTIRG